MTKSPQQEERPWYYREAIPSMLRRMKDFDYASPGYYFFTLMLRAPIPRLSHIAGRAFKPVNAQSEFALVPETDKAYGPQTVLHHWGNVVTNEVYALEKRFPLVVKELAVMPDHIHVLILVTEYNKRKLGGIVSSLKGRCSRALWDAVPELKDEKFWQRGYNDKPVLKKDQLPRFYHYIKENPRKYLIRKSIPDYFYKRWQFEYNGEVFHAIGNIFLLMNPVRAAIRFSRKFSEQEFEQMKEYWRTIAKKGDVVISTYIHPEERKVTKECTTSGAKLIWIKYDGFPPRSAIKGEEAYNLCAQGRLLMIAPEKYHTSNQKPTYPQCMRLNNLAAYLCTHDILPLLTPLKS